MPQSGTVNPPNSYRDVLRVSLPLVISMTTTVVMSFTDRVFLANYSIDAIAAALPAAIIAFVFIAFFADTAGYSNVIIAQYTGAGVLTRVGSALWQAIYFALAAWLIMVGISFIGGPLFRLVGHPAEVQQLEITYFRVLCLGAGIHIVGMSFSSFFTGRGVTRPVMVIYIFAMFLNVPLDYALINGIWIFPELGILGAGIATVISWTTAAVLLGLFVFTRENNHIFEVFNNHAFDADLFRRLLRYGVPSSLQFSLDVFAFVFFVFMVGRIGKPELAVTNIAISLDSVSFRPLMGFALGTSTLVGQALGRNRPGEAVAAARSTMVIVASYISVLVLLYLVFPQPLLELFRPRDFSTADFAAIKARGVVVLRFVAAYLLLDGIYMISTAVLKGAGDTKFIMWSIGLSSIFGMILPVYIGIEIFGMGLYYAWGCTVFFLCQLAAISFWRFYQGKWKTMRVIEQ
ncbi:MATE efflux family protein [Olavius sp. associated proteobacterium Delta 1]|nr:MATE efflux family protein [Olavius sp. associated proteobacterium Delta 1]